MNKENMNLLNGKQETKKTTLKINRGPKEDSSTKSKSLFSKKSSEPETNNDVKILEQEGMFEDELTGIRISQSLSVDQIEQQRHDFCGMSLDDMLSDLEARRQEIEQSLDRFIKDKGYIEIAKKDLNLVFDSILFPLTKFTFTEGNSVVRQILRRVEKILASDPQFYNRNDNERLKAFDKEINRYLPSRMLEIYGEILLKERRNPFSIYYNLLQDIEAQDFIITGGFLNIQYKLGEYFYIDIPDYIRPFNSLFVDHICTDYMYSRGEKFGQKDSIKDLEDQGFRFNFIYKNIVATNESVIFARKNTHGVAKVIEDSNYYLDLLSDVDETDEKKKQIIELMRRTAGEKNFLVVGPTGSGKTTLLRQMLLDREREQNLITIEDTKELNLPNAIAYLTDKDHTIHDIFVSTLRMNPSRVVVGETRDQTILDILELCLTAKSATTLHATDIDKCITRIRMMSKGLITSGDLDYLLSAAIDMFVFIIDRKITGLYIKDPAQHFTPGEGILSCYKKII